MIKNHFGRSENDLLDDWKSNGIFWPLNNRKTKFNHKFTGWTRDLRSSGSWSVVITWPHLLNQNAHPSVKVNITWLHILKFHEKNYKKNLNNLALEIKKRVEYYLIIIKLINIIKNYLEHLDKSHRLRLSQLWPNSSNFTNSESQQYRHVIFMSLPYSSLFLLIFHPFFA